MREFQWKNNFINQDKTVEHINKYVLLLLMLKVKRCNTTLLEKEIASLKVLDFIYYEEFFLNEIKPKSENLSNPDKFLHNQDPFKEIIEKFTPGEKLETSKIQQKQLFEIFSRYVNLKDVKLLEKTYKGFAYGIIFFLFLLESYFSDHNVWVLMFVNLIEIILCIITSYIFKGKSKSIRLNYWRINEELCYIELQKELEELEKLLNIKHDPYEENTYKELWDKFKIIFDVPDNFIERCRAKGIIDENNFVINKNNNNHNFIQYLKQKRKEEYKNEKFDWLLINHIVILDIGLNRKSEFVKKDFKFDSKKGEYISEQGKDFARFCELLDNN